MPSFELCFQVIVDLMLLSPLQEELVLALMIVLVASTARSIDRAHC